MKGLHTSVNSNIAEFFTNESGEQFTNIDYYFEKVGNFPERIENLYFYYSVILRAINYAHKQIINVD